MSIETYGTGERIRVAARLSSTLGTEHLVILPVPTTKDKRTVFGTDVLLDETLVNVGVGSVVVGYGLPEEYKFSAEQLGAKVFDLALDEVFLSENAYITAIGTLAYVFGANKRIVRDFCVGVIGYGRIGSQLVRMLLFFGARVKVYTTKMLTRINLGECGVDCVCPPDSPDGKYDFSGIDILINTAPKNMATAFENKKVPDGMTVIELASGDNFSGIEGVVKLPALPERMYPESAGREYFKAIERFVKG